MFCWRTRGVGIEQKPFSDSFRFVPFCIFLRRVEQRHAAPFSTLRIYTRKLKIEAVVAQYARLLLDSNAPHTRAQQQHPSDNGGEQTTTKPTCKSKAWLNLNFMSRLLVWCIVDGLPIAKR